MSSREEDENENDEGVDYRRLSTRELLVLADRGDDAAIDELERRRNLLRH